LHLIFKTAAFCFCSFRPLFGTLTFLIALARKIVSTLTSL
jgi:hypothetical protein